jgi:aspartate aminotransferase
MQISNRAQDIQESPIRKLAAIANQTMKKGISIFHLNIGQPDIATPDIFYQNIRNFSDKVLSYGPSDGMEELKKAMITYFSHYKINLELKDIVISTGGSEAISFTFNVIGDQGDEIIIPEPFYTNYNGYASLSNLKIVPVTTSPESGFHLPDMSEIEGKITERTRAIMICSPNNPTGTVFTETEINQLAELAKKHDLFLIADEVYKEFTYDGENHFSLLQLNGLEDRVIVVDSISKRYSACGARIGAVFSKNEVVMKSILKFAQARLCPPGLEQIGAIGAYQLPMDYFTKIRQEYQKRRDILYDILTSEREILLRKPKGAFYIMAKLPVDDSDTFARWLLEDFSSRGETVMVAPGAGFYCTPGKGKQEVRIAYVLEEKKLERAGQIFIEAIRTYNQKKNKTKKIS